MFHFILAMAPADVTVRASVTEGFTGGTTVSGPGAPAVATKGGSLGGLAGFDIMETGPLSSDILAVTGQGSYSDLQSSTGSTYPATYALSGAYRHQQTLSERVRLMASVGTTVQKSDPGIPGVGGAAAISAVGATTSWLGNASVSISHDLSPSWGLLVTATGSVGDTLSAPAATAVEGLNLVGGGLSGVVTYELSQRDRLLGMAAVTSSDFVNVVEPGFSSLHPISYVQELATGTVGFSRELSLSWSSASTAGVAVASATPLVGLAVQPVASEQIRYTAETAFFTAMAGYQYSSPTLLVPGGQQLALTARGSGTLGRLRPLRNLSVAGGLSASRTAYTGGGGSLAFVTADFLVRYALTSWLGVLAGTALTYSESQSTLSSQVDGISVFMGFSGYMTTMPDADPFTSVMAVPVAR